MTPFEMMDTLDAMEIIVDTREQPNRKAEARYRGFGVPWVRKKLDFGDYSAAFGEGFTLEGKVAVERKMSLDELCQCYTHDRERFTREFERAKDAGARVYLLCENASWEKIYAGAYRSKMRETALTASILAFLARYDCRLIFCRAETSGKLIKDILYREARERLEAAMG